MIQLLQYLTIKIFRGSYILILHAKRTCSAHSHYTIFAKLVAAPSLTQFYLPVITHLYKY